jgi:GT2 family glycosyltransferase
MSVTGGAVVRRTAAVVIPTRNRPQKLAHCLSAIRDEGDVGENITIIVADSSTSEALRNDTALAAVKAGATYVYHGLVGAAAARNFGARRADCDVIISLDDDVYVRPGALSRIMAPFASDMWKVVAGAVRFDSNWSTPVKMRPIGYGRPVREGESPDFLISAFLAYPRALVLEWPWPESLVSSEDRFMGTVWRFHGVPMAYVPDALAIHDADVHSYGVDHYRYHIYANLSDAVFAHRSPMLVATFEAVGLALALRQAGLGQVLRCAAAWCKGHSDWIRDRRALKRVWFSPSSASSSRTNI